ncbi:MAG: 4Fe-4S dicluster domain-containing protein [Bryobacteraceae bacterium]
MTARLREAARRLLAEGKVQVVIGWGESGRPVFVKRPEDANKLAWNHRCFANLTVYLKRKEVRALGKPALVVKGCDERALVVLEQEAQVERSGVYVIGVACDGVSSPKCAACQVRKPRFADVIIGEPAAGPAGAAESALGALLRLSRPERFAYWKAEFARCTRCYACRQVCPLCYCERCVADKNRPVAIDTSATLKGNFAWHITRAFHLAGRCVQCGECSRVCPAGIKLGLLNRTLARAADQCFGYRAGMDPDSPPVIGAWSPRDKEDFIR